MRQLARFAWATAQMGLCGSPGLLPCSEPEAPASRYCSKLPWGRRYIVFEAVGEPAAIVHIRYGSSDAAIAAERRQDLSPGGADDAIGDRQDGDDRMLNLLDAP